MRLMIVDDHAGVRKMIRQLAATPEDILLECASGDEAVAQVAEFKPDVVTMDVRMPGLGGFEAAREIRRLHPESRIIMVTSHDQPFLRQLAADVGAVGYVLKDNLGELRTMLTRETPPRPEPGSDAVQAAFEQAIEIQFLRQRLEQFRLLVENSLDLVVQLTLQGQVLYISPNVKAVLGYESFELVGTSVFDHVHPEDLPGVLEKFTLPQAQVTCRYRHKDGSWRWLETTGRDFLTPGGEIQSALIARDITARLLAETEKKQLETQLRQAQKLETLGALAGGVAHDFNNIIVSITGYAQLAMLETQNQPDVQGYLAQVLNAGDRARDLVRQILAFSRQQPSERKPVSLRAIARDVLCLLQPGMSKSIEATLVCNTDLQVMADASQMHQVLLNLCTNALQAMPEGLGQLEVRMTPLDVTQEFAATVPGLRAGPNVHLSVTDTGHGMSEETIKQIFEPFFTTKDPGKGTGIGLAIVRSIVSQHGGAIQVNSRAKEGTTFHVYLPAYTQQV